MDIKQLAAEAADALIDRYLDVTDLSEEFDLTQFDSESAKEFADEVAAVVRNWVINAIKEA